MTRPPSGRSVAATGWAAALVLTGGVLTAGLSGSEPPARAEAVAVAPPTPSPSPSPVPSPEPPPEPSPEPSPESSPVAAAPAKAEDPVEQALGAPPGPQADARPARTAAPQDRYAFLVGVQDYRGRTTDTIGSAKDVRFLAEQLRAAGWLPQNIRVVLDGEATGAAVRAGLAWLAEKGQPGTFSLFHYSGHVKQLGGGTEALWPVDRDFVRDTALAQALSRVQGRMWVDIAGCEAGSFLPGLPSDRVLVTASSKGTEKSYEYPEWAMSVWTGLLLDLGMEQGMADADRDGRVTIGEATRYATYYAQVITLTQRPHGRQTPQVEGDPVRGWTLADPPA